MHGMTSGKLRISGIDKREAYSHGTYREISGAGHGFRKKDDVTALAEVEADQKSAKFAVLEGDFKRTQHHGTGGLAAFPVGALSLPVMS